MCERDLFWGRSTIMLLEIKAYSREVMRFNVTYLEKNAEKSNLSTLTDSWLVTWILERPINILRHSYIIVSFSKVLYHVWKVLLRVSHFAEIFLFHNKNSGRQLKHVKLSFMLTRKVIKENIKLGTPIYWWNSFQINKQLLSNWNLDIKIS